QRDHSVDVRISEELIRRKTPCYVLADRGRTVDRRNHGQVIASARTAVGPPITLKGIAVQAPGRRRRLAGRRVVELQLAAREVVAVHPLARLDILSRHPDRLTVLQHPLTARYPNQRQLMPKT